MNTIPFLYGELNKKVTPIEQSFIIRNTVDDFPRIGSDSKLYLSRKSGQLYYWNAETAEYLPTKNYLDGEEQD